MEVAGTVLSAIQTILSALESPHLKKILSIYGFESKLDELQSTVNTINSVLLDADAKQELSNVAQHLINELKDVVFEAEDLLDEFVTLAEQNKHFKADGITISKKMKRFLSRSNPLLVAFKMSKGVDKIRKKLDAFAYNKHFMMEFNHEPIRFRKPETCSYVDVVEIVGREADLEHIVGKLVDSDVQTDVSFLSIVGMGGLGKTALAQLVYNDTRVEKAFDLRLWHCVSDQDQKQLDIVGIVGKILGLNSTYEKCTDQCSLQIVQSRLQKELSNKKYLLVLDDVWTENRNQWIELVRLLKVGQKGSWIVVTTRSEVTAKFMGSGSMYQLKGLGKKDSRSLFEKVAFGSEQWNHNDDLVEIGQKIVEACGGVPLAIRVAGSLVYGQDKKKWEAVQEVGVANMGKNDITQILKLSYHHLPFSLKNCFSYCAIFPKDYAMNKDMLINLWMANNYIVPLHEGQSIEDACEEHFLILLRRCFFQNIEKDYETGEINYVMIHDLLHDIAQGVSRKEISATTTISGNLDKNARHLSITSYPEYGKFPMSINTRVRSFLAGFSVCNEWRPIFDFVETLVENCRNLRALQLSDFGDECLSNSIGKLLHLRYLDLSYNYKLKVIPKSITKLCNLETLILFGCRSLKELPKDLSKLVKLRVLDILYCCELKYMPKGMDKLTCLYKLSDFIVGGDESCSSCKEWYFGLEELKSLNNLKGHLTIKFGWPKIGKNFSQCVWESKGLFLRDKKHLNYILIDFFHVMGDDTTILDNNETTKLMEDLQPPSSLQVFSVKWYLGTKMPKWISYLPNLVVLTIADCVNLEYLETFENVDEGSFLPSLQQLNLSSLPKLKGWRRRGIVMEDNNNPQSELLPSLLHLKKLVIEFCPEIMFFPVCPRLEILSLRYFSKKLKVIIKTKKDDKKSREVIVFESSNLREVDIDDVAWLNSLPVDAFQCLEILRINNDKEVENLAEVEKVFRACSSLRFLKIANCPKLRSVVVGGLEYLSTLEKLVISECVKLKVPEEKEKDGSDVDMGINTCPYLLPSLHTLEIEGLPNWTQFLTALQTLKIKDIYRIKAMPNWMSKLTFLKQLEISQCLQSLKRRCNEPDGEDWPYVQHITNIQFMNIYINE